MSLEVFGDGGDGEDLSELALRYGYLLLDDNLWHEFENEPGLNDEQMWEYVTDRMEEDIEDMLLEGA